MKEKSFFPDVTDKNPSLQRLVEFLAPKGKRPSTIAKEVGMSDNIFSNMIQRDTEPSVGLLRGLSIVYPDLDVHYISTGEFSMRQLALEDQLQKAKEEISRYRQDLERERGLLDKFAAKTSFKSGVSNHPQVDREWASELLDKSRAKNIRTANLIGLRSFMRNPSNQ